MFVEKTNQPQAGWGVRRNPRMMADLNNDGQSDIVGVANEGVVVLYSTSTADAPSFAAAESVVKYFGTNSSFRPQFHPSFVIDVNGDGKDDVVGFGDYGTYVYLLPGDE